MDHSEIWRRLLAGTEQLALRPEFGFDPAFYLGEYPDCTGFGQTPERHYTAYGRAEGRFPTLFRKIIRMAPDLAERLARVVTDPELSEALARGDEAAAELAFEALALGGGLDLHLSDFSAGHYLALYPEVADSWLKPIGHYLLHGQAEGRRTLREARQGLYAGRQRALADRPTCLIVAPDLSGIGASADALLLAQGALADHTVILAAVQDGARIEAFRDACHQLIVTETPEADLPAVLPDWPERIDFAVLCSVEATPFLRFLVRWQIPLASLLPDFADTVVPAWKATFAALFANLLVFPSLPARASWEAVLTELEIDARRDVLVLTPPALLAGQAQAEARMAARARLSNRIGTDIGSRRLVIGSGPVHWRSGTDLFALTAEIARQKDPAAIFIWLGDGPNRDEPEGGIWMDRQLAQSGANSPEGNLFLLPEGEDRRDLCRSADAVFLCARNDHLPQMAFDAAACGAQVIAFQGATGFDDPSYDACATLHRVKHADLVEAARWLLDQHATPAPAKTHSVPGAPASPFATIATALKARLSAQRYFAVGPGDFDVPVLVSGADRDAPAREREREAIWSLGRRFVWRSRAEAQEAVARADDWYHKGMTVQEHALVPAAAAGDFCVHLHAYYIEDLREDLQRHAAFRAARRLVITTDSARKADQVRGMAQAEGLAAEVLHTPNHGRDILPFLRIFEAETGEPADEIWCHVHQKKALGSSPAGDVWRRFMLAILLGDATQLSSAATLIARPDCGLVAAFDPYAHGWSGSRALLPRFQSRLPGPAPANPLLFPAGNMFWTRRDVAKAMLAVFGSEYPWPNEPLPHDGTVFHLTERLWPAMAAATGRRAVFLDKADQRRR